MRVRPLAAARMPSLPRLSVRPRLCRLPCLLFAPILALYAAPGCALVREQLTWSSYDVNVHAGRVVPQLLAASPLPPHPRNPKPLGMTSPRITWTYNHAIGEDRMCRITGVTVDLRSTITVPRLVGGDAAQQAAFDTFLAALREHELGHHKIAREQAQALEHMVRSLPAARDCDALYALAVERVRFLNERHHERQAQFDADRSAARDIPWNF